MQTIREGHKIEKKELRAQTQVFSEETRKRLAGKIIECFSCKFQGKVDENDHFERGYNKWQSWISVTCPNCGHSIDVECVER